MIGKKKCGVCNEKVRNSHNFCPNCGSQVRDSKDNWGMLGKNDSGTEKIGIFGNMGDKMIDKFMAKMLNQGMKIVEKELQKGIVKRGSFSQPKLKLMINGKEILPENAKLTKKDPNVKFLPIEFSEDNLERWKRIKKKEPKSKLKRVEDKIEYEVEVPGVKSIKDISIVKLENSLEVKAVGEKTGYLKRIPIDLPLKKYSLVKGILTLELDAI
ncbi:MAG: zinc ribbon domain-containing protein [Nanoarchaeota archaeon]|nr:zinc ribbon domain-containing protein [Nanoarchaeota archaeon]